jgi:sugar (pentulose or hexulose) kinase
MTRMIRDEIRGMFRDPVFLAGGGASRNTFLMQLTSDVLGTPVTLVDVSELSALGAAVTAAEGAGDDSVVLNARRAMEERRLEPSDAADLVRSKTAQLEDRLRAVWARQ